MSQANLSNSTSLTPPASVVARPLQSLTYLTRKEAAAYLRWSEASLKRRGMLGLPPRTIKIGRSVRYARDDLDAFMSAGRSAA
jgi:predicted DNA-binding transcriptional regulator AlpA